MDKVPSNTYKQHVYNTLIDKTTMSLSEFMRSTDGYTIDQLVRWFNATQGANNG